MCLLAANLSARWTVGGLTGVSVGVDGNMLRRPPANDLVADLFGDIASDLAAVEATLHEQLRAENPLLEELGTHLLKGGGKRLRPALVLLSAQPFDYRPERLIPVAVAVELIHMATLIHDDIVDEADLRRGLPTVNARWGSSVSVLLGDYLFARAFSILAETGDNRLVRIMAEVVFRMSEGELEHTTGTFNVSRAKDAYLEHIDKKTATFIAECCRVGALLGAADEVAVEALGRYGQAIGIGFQIVDDILDFAGSARELGKPPGTDLLSGVITLPVLYALQHDKAGAELRELIEDRRFDRQGLERAVNIVRSSGALEYTYEVAMQYVSEAKDVLQILPDSRPRRRLLQIADFITRRRS